MKGRTYVISDIHGYKVELEEMKRKIGFKNTDNLIILGDIIDRGPDGIQLIKDVMEARNIELILGNHELMMYEYLSEERKGKSEEKDYALLNWYRNGGLVTHEDYKRESKESQERIYEYLGSLGYKKEIDVGGESYILVHGQLGYDKESTVWGRVGERRPILEGRKIVYGHTPTKRYAPEQSPMRVWRGYEGYIGIDCGMAARGSGGEGWNMACLCLETGEVTYIKD